MPESDREERLLRLESTDEIRQLVAKYCLALDMRDLDALCGLFPEDVRVGGGQQGRARAAALVRRDAARAVQRNRARHGQPHHRVREPRPRARLRLQPQRARDRRRMGRS